MMDKRNIGLDYFRTWAIMLVLMSHSRHLFTYNKDIDWWMLSVGGYLGVELFFVLSGFLIGKILIEKVLSSTNKIQALKLFMIRRWFRTLPLYYLILLVYIIVNYYQNNEWYFSWAHIFFLQNFSQDGLVFFGVSWSLSVEEWFYLCMPLALLLCMHIFTILNHNKNQVLSSIIIMLTVIIVVKMIFVAIFPEWTWTDIRKNIFLRFDSLLVGVLVAYLQSSRNQLFDLMGTNKYMFGNLFLLTCLVAWYYHLGESGLDKDWFSKALMFTLTSVVLSVLMVWCFWNIKKEFLFFTYGSKLSYGIYLIHFIFLDYYIHLAQIYHNPYLSILLLALFLFSTISVSYLLWKYYEFPMMNIRDKFTS